MTASLHDQHKETTTRIRRNAMTDGLGLTREVASQLFQSSSVTDHAWAQPPLWPHLPHLHIHIHTERHTTTRAHTGRVGVVMLMLGVQFAVSLIFSQFLDKCLCLSQC